MNTDVEVDQKADAARARHRGRVVESDDARAPRREGQAPERASETRTSVDPMRMTDRYRLVRPPLA